MSNELVYGDATRFVHELTLADARAREFFREVVTYLTNCVKTLSSYRESITGPSAIPASAWAITIEQDADSFSIASQFSAITLLCSKPLGTVRFVIIDIVEDDSPFFEGPTQGYLRFSGTDSRKAKSPGEATAHEPAEDKFPAPQMSVSEGFLPAIFNAGSPAGFAEPLFAQLFAPLPIAPLAAPANAAQKDGR